MENVYTEVKFSVPIAFKDVLLHDPYFTGVKSQLMSGELTDHRENSDGIFTFTLKNPTISDAKIVGFSLADKEIPYEMGAKKNSDKYEEFMRVQYTRKNNGTALKCYETHKLDDKDNPVFYKDPDDYEFVDNISQIPLTEAQKEMVANAKVLREEYEAEQFRKHAQHQQANPQAVTKAVNQIELTEEKNVPKPPKP